MQLIRSERPEMRLPANRLESWFRRPLFGHRDWLGLFDWDSPGDSFLTNTRLGADFYEDSDAYHIRMELPGVAKEDLRVDLENAVLTVSCGQSEEDEQSGRVTRTFSRSVSIPDGIVAEQISAGLKDGILTITVPKAEATKPRKIEVS